MLSVPWGHVLALPLEALSDLEPGMSLPVSLRFLICKVGTAGTDSEPAETELCLCHSAAPQLPEVVPSQCVLPADKCECALQTVGCSRQP